MKKKAIKEFLIGLSVLTIILAVALWVMTLVVDITLPAVTPGIFVFLVVVTALVHLAFIFSSETDGQTSVSLLMGTIVGKLIINLIFIILLVYFVDEDVISLTLTYFILFIMFTAYEIVMISRFINSGKA